MENKRVTFDAYFDKLDDQQTIKLSIGLFQRWGNILLYKDEKYHSICCGIVLGEDNIVYCVPPNHIKVIN
jgi:hypothetical protein